MSGMEARHAANILRKAERAAELLEQVLLERVYPDLARHNALNAAYEALYDNAPEGQALWTALEIAYTLHYNRNRPTTFDASRPAIASVLERRIRETSPARTVDPFDIFADNHSAKN